MGCDSQQVPKEADLGALKNFYKEFYKRHFPCLTYKSLNASQPAKTTIYGEVEPYSDRQYTDYSMPILFSMDPEEFNAYTYGIDPTRQVIFYICQPILEEDFLPTILKVKAGDQILFDNHEYEIRTAKRKADRYFAFFNYAFELAIVADIPNPGS